MEHDQELIDKQIADAVDRIDRVLEKNKNLVLTVVIMAVLIFALGMMLLIIGSTSGDWRILTPSAIVTGLLYWPINRVLRIRKENIALAVVPVLVKTLPPEQAAKEIVKLISKVWS